MSNIKKEEMFGNLKSFLKSKGIDVQEGSYANGIRRGCDILTDTVNMSQRALDRAKVAVDQKRGLDKARQTVHEYTAPKGTAGQRQDGRLPPAAKRNPRRRKSRRRKQRRRPRPAGRAGKVKVSRVGLKETG